MKTFQEFKTLTLSEQTITVMTLTLFFCLPISTVLTHIVSILLFLSVIVYYRQQLWASKLWQHPIVIMIASLLLYYLLSSSWTIAEPQEALNYLRKFLKLLMLPVFIFVIRKHQLRNPLLFIFLFSMLITLVLGLQKNANPTAVFRDTIHTSLLFALSSYFSLCLTRHTPYKRTGYFLFSIFTLYLFFLTNGRTGYLIYFVLVGLFLLEQNKRQVLLGFLILTFILSCTTLFSTQFKARINDVAKEWALIQAGEGNNTSIGQRLEYATRAWNLILKEPIFGYGLGSTRKAFCINNENHQQMITSNVHNEYLSQTLQFGVAGLSLFLAFFLTIWRCSRALPPFEGRIARGICLTLIFGCFFNSWLMDHLTSFVLILFLSIAFGAKSHEAS